MARVDPVDPAALLAALTTQGDRVAIAAATAAAVIEQQAPTEIFCDIYNKFYKAPQRCADYIELQATWPRNKPNIGNLQLKGSDPLCDTVLTCHEATVPVVIEVGTLRWSGRVDVAHDKFGENTPDMVDCELLGDFAWLTRIVAWSSFLAPIIAQFPPRGNAIGPAVSVIKWIIATQCFRLQSGIWDMVNNIENFNIDWRTWFGTLLMQDLGDDQRPGLDDIMRMLRTPIYVVPTDPLHDTSEFVAITWRFQKISELIEQIVEDNGLSVEACVWLPGDPQPHDNMLFPLTVPTIVVDVKDRMAIVGPTGTLLDGALRLLVDIEGSMFGQALTPLLNPKGEYVPAELGFNIAPAIGVDFIQPWCLFNGDNNRAGLKGEMVHHHPLAWRILAGGKSPAWLNSIINATTSWLLDMVMIAIGITGVPSDLFSGLFNDVLFAFQLIDLMDRRMDLGPYGFPESFTPTEHGTYQLDMLFVILRAIWDTRGYVSGTVTFQQNYPYELGRDVFPGALASLVRRGKVYTDYIENATLIDNRTDRAKVVVQIGDSKAEDAPAAKLQRRLVALQTSLFNSFMLATQS